MEELVLTDCKSFVRYGLEKRSVTQFGERMTYFYLQKVKNKP